MSTPAAESRFAALPEPGRVTVNYVLGQLLKSNVPMISQMLRIIKDLSQRPESLSVNDLADYISSEPTTLSQVISISNTLGYNTGGTEVVSAHHAISVIGFNRVRTLAFSILLLESAQSRGTAEINRELAGAALICGLVAADISRRGTAADPETAFVCGVLRGYGRMLAATFLPKEYAEALKISALEGNERAFEIKFGLTPLELGREILIHIKVPDQIINSFEKASRVLHSGSSIDPADALIASADFGLRTAELLQAPDLTNDNFEPRFLALSNLYDFPAKLGRDDVRQLLHHLTNVIGSFRYQASVYMDTVMIFRRLKHLADQKPLPAIGGTLIRDLPQAKSAPPPQEEPQNYEI